MMIDAVMYGMIPRAKIANVGERAAGEQVEEAEDAARLGLVLQLLDRARGRCPGPAGVHPSR